MFVNKNLHASIDSLICHCAAQVHDVHVLIMSASMYEKKCNAWTKVIIELWSGQVRKGVNTIFVKRSTRHYFEITVWDVLSNHKGTTTSNT